MISHSFDGLVAANPVLCSLVLYSFVRGYSKANDESIDFALALLPVPIALSERWAGRFEGTTLRTGLLGWVNTLGGELSDVPVLLARMESVSRSAVRFGLKQQILEIRGGRLLAREGQLKRVPGDDPKDPMTKRPFTVASRLGAWCGDIRSTSFVYSILGVRS